MGNLGYLSVEVRHFFRPALFGLLFLLISACTPAAPVEEPPTSTAVPTSSPTLHPIYDPFPTRTPTIDPDYTPITLQKPSLGTWQVEAAEIKSRAC